MIDPIPPLSAGLQEAALNGRLVPFVGAGASRLAGCPNWTEFADRALRYFVEKGKINHCQLAQLSQQNPRVKLSIAQGLQRQHNLQIDYETILYPQGRNNNQRGQKLYEALSRLGNTFVTTNYDDWLDTTLAAPPPKASNESGSGTPTIPEKPISFYRADEMTPDKLARPHSVFHLHGSVHDASSMILTTQDYVRHYANDRRAYGSHGENTVLTFLEFLFSQRNVLFVGYGLEELEILEYVIVKARLRATPGKTEMRHFMLQGFFSHEEELARSLASYYAECGIELIPFLRDLKDWEQLIDILDDYSTRAPAGAPLKLNQLKEMEAMLDD